MASKQKDVAPVTVSPVLFMTVDGEPMTFFLRPGPTKRNLQPLISAGGGMLCNIQQPGAILLINPEERSSIPESTAHWYVSTQYIHDCIEKEEQLNIEDYRLNPEVQKQSAKPNTSKNSSPGLSGGRIPYTPEEDEAILKYVSKHTAEIGGNRLWQEMEKQHLTSHSWQSMKYRYRVRLAKRLSEFVEVETTEEDGKSAEEMTEVEENQETDIQELSCEEDVSHSEETDMTQIDAQVLPSGSRADNADAPTSISSVTDDQHVNQQAEEQPAENTQVESEEAEPCPSLQTEGPCAKLQTDTQLSADETTESEGDATLTTVSPQKQSLQEDSAPAQSSPLLKTPSSAKKTKGKQKATPEQNQSERRLTRRRLELDTSSTPEPYGKKLRSSSTPAERATPSPQSAKKTKSAKSVPQKDATAEQTPSKRARGKDVAAEEETQREQSGHATVSETEDTRQEQSGHTTVSETEDTQQEQSGHTTVSETTQADEPTSPPQKKKQKRQIGILELASKEFEDGSESDEDETPDLQNSAGTAATLTKALAPPSDIAADPASSKSNPEPGPIPHKDAPRTPHKEAPRTPRPGPIPHKDAPRTPRPGPIPHKDAPRTPHKDAPRTPRPGPIPHKDAPRTPHPGPPAAAAAAAAEPPVSKAHLFIFDSESQERASQSIFGSAAPSNPEPTVSKAATLSLTQAQLEEDKQRIRALMKQTKQDLVSVTTALLKTSGDFSAAIDLLLNPSTISGPFWNRHDDDLLLSDDPDVRQQLQEKYGEENVAKRIMFLEVEG